MFQLHYVIYLTLIAAGFLAGLFRTKEGAAIMAITLMLGITLGAEITSKILAYSIRNNNAIYHFFLPLQSLLCATFFYFTLRSWTRQTVIPLSVLMIVFAFANSIFWQDLASIPDRFAKLECLVLIFWSFCLFIEFLDKPGKENIFRDRVFIICIAILWFNLVSFPFFDLINLYFKKKQLARELIGNAHYLSNYTYYFMLFLSMLLKPQPLSNGR